MKYLIFGLVFLLLILPAGVSAQSGLVPCNGPDCNACHLVATANTVVNFLIQLLSVIGVIVLVVAGFRLVTSGGDAGAAQKAKGMFTNVIIGFVLVLSAWLIVDTILVALTDRDGLKMWTNISCSTGVVSTTGSSESTGTESTDPTSIIAGQKYTDAQARKVLSASGISVNKTVAQGTSLEGINRASINDAIALKQACGCDVTLTAGTETANHAIGALSHGSGYKYDIRLNSGLNSYITSNYTDAGVRGDGAKMYTSPGGNVYALEGNHWDVLVK